MSKTINLMTLVVAVAALLPHINAQCFSKNDAVTGVTADKLYTGQQKFAISLLNAVNNGAKTGNLFFSPHSIYRVLLLAYFGANGETEDALAKMLNLDWAKSKAEVSQAFQLEKKLRESRALDQLVEFKSAEKIYVAKDVELRSCVKEILAENVEQLDFVNEPQKCQAVINGFVEDVTKGRIKDILPPDMKFDKTGIVLANAAFFKGSWVSQFNKKRTKSNVFYTNGRTPVNVETMEQTNVFEYGNIEELNTHTLKMPYIGENGTISMVVLLPDETETTIDDLLAGLTPEILNEAINDGEPIRVVLEFPKISLTGDVKLRPVLDRMGVGNLFETNSNLKGFSEKNNLKFDDAMHKAEIEIDEEGTTAAAATVIFENRSIVQIKFICNRPFLFVIHDEKSNEILFTGVYRGPSTSE